MFRDSQLTDQRAAGKIGVELLQNHVGIRPEAFEINHSPLVGQTPDEDILRRRQVGAQAQFLMNKAYADILGFFGTPGGNRRAFKQDLALRGRKHAADDVHEGRFPGTILAAREPRQAAPGAVPDPAPGFRERPLSHPVPPTDTRSYSLLLFFCQR